MHTKLLVGKLKERDTLRDIDIDRIILIWDLKK
jgi:hypothetical protein